MACACNVVSQLHDGCVIKQRANQLRRSQQQHARSLTTTWYRTVDRNICCSVYKYSPRTTRNAALCTTYVLLSHQTACSHPVHHAGLMRNTCVKRRTHALTPLVARNRPASQHRLKYAARTAKESSHSQSHTADRQRQRRTAGTNAELSGRRAAVAARLAPATPLHAASNIERTRPASARQGVAPITFCHARPPSPSHSLALHAAPHGAAARTASSGRTMARPSLCCTRTHTLPLYTPCCQQLNGVLSTSSKLAPPMQGSGPPRRRAQHRRQAAGGRDLACACAGSHVSPGAYFTAPGQAHAPNAGRAPALRRCYYSRLPPAWVASRSDCHACSCHLWCEQRAGRDTTKVRRGSTTPLHTRHARRRLHLCTPRASPLPHLVISWWSAVISSNIRAPPMGS